MKYFNKRTKIILGIFALVFAVATGTATWATFTGKIKIKADTGNYSIRGYVNVPNYNQSSGFIPVAGATVIASSDFGSERMQTSSGADGSFIFNGLKNSSVFIIAFKDCVYQLWEGNTDQIAYITMHQPKNEYHVLGIITDSTNGQPLPGVEITGGDGGTSDKFGFYSVALGATTDGNAILTFKKDGYYDQSQTVSGGRLSCGFANLNVQMVKKPQEDNNGRLSGYITLTDTRTNQTIKLTPTFISQAAQAGKPLSLVAYDNDLGISYPLIDNTVIDENGFYFIPIPPDSYNIKLKMTGLFTGESDFQHFVVNANQGVQQDWNLKGTNGLYDSKVTMSISVKPDGVVQFASYATAQIDITDGNGNLVYRAPYQTLLDIINQPAFTFSVPPGTYKIYYTHSEPSGFGMYHNGPSTVKVEAGKSQTININACYYGSGYGLTLPAC